MTVRLRVRHLTRYIYGAPAAFSQHVLRLIPPERHNQHVVSAEVAIDPVPDDRESFDDPFGNRLISATLARPHDRLEIVATCVVERTPEPDLMRAASTPWEEVAALMRTPAGLAAAPFAFATPLTRADDALEAWARESFTPGRPLIEAARELSSRIHTDFSYAPGATGPETDALAAFHARAGVCQDFAQVMAAACRALGLPAAYVSGWLRTLPPPGRARLVGADASHAWASVWDPAAGWTSFDPTNDMEPGADHVSLARGRDYADCAPVSGVVVGSGGQTLEVSVDVAAAEEGAPLPA